jgi:hypothetical protein
MMVMIVSSYRKKTADEVSAPGEAEALLKSMLAYGGTYTSNSNAMTNTHHLELSWYESRKGKDFVRDYTLECDVLTLTKEPSTDIVTRPRTVRRLRWEKEQ